MVPDDVVQDFAVQQRSARLPVVFLPIALNQPETRLFSVRWLMSIGRSTYPRSYSISSKIRNIGKYIATMMLPTIPPTTTIMRGSMTEVKALTAASTSDS